MTPALFTRLIAVATHPAIVAMATFAATLGFILGPSGASIA